jgi:L-cysteine desulfidase
MRKTDEKYRAYVQILKEELVPAMGCTEPIALAYAAAKAREVLGRLPEKVLIEASGSIIKNVKSVIVPNTNHLKGIPAAATAGIIAGKAEKELEVISKVTPEQIEQMKDFLADTPIEVRHVNNGLTFEIAVTVYAGESYARVRIVNYHTNIVLIEKDGEKLLEIEVKGESEEGLTDRSLLDMESIWNFAMTVDIADVYEVLHRQYEYNMAISEEGFRGDYGANIGSVLLDMEGQNIRTRAKARAVAGSDARMNGCELPVCIISGSGNQGITASVPVVIYAKELGKSEDEMLRAVLVSDLITTHLKTGIGCLSAYCGAISAGCGCGAGIAYLKGGKFKEIAHTIVNALAILSGTICDGAKSSCAAKIAMAVESGILALEMYENGKQFYGGDGIVSKGVENTIANVGRLASQGMSGTDKEIIKIMLQ